MRRLVAALAYLIVGGIAYFVLAFGSWALTQFVNATVDWLAPVVIVGLLVLGVRAIWKA